jgi:hypothetical protein
MGGLSDDMAIGRVRRGDLAVRRVDAGVIPKPKRLVDKRAIEAARKPWCEYCGKAGPTEVHHWEHSRGAGGDDLPANLIALCAGPNGCHQKAHMGLISKDQLREIVRRRENGCQGIDMHR